MNREKMRQISTKAVGDEGSPANWGPEPCGNFKQAALLGAGAELARAQHEYLSPLHPVHIPLSQLNIPKGVRW